MCIFVKRNDKFLSCLTQMKHIAWPIQCDFLFALSYFTYFFLIDKKSVKHLFCFYCDANWYSTTSSKKSTIKGRGHCFSMQVVMNKCFLLNTEKKIGADSVCHFREKRKNAPLLPKNDVTEPKARLLQ